MALLARDDPLCPPMAWEGALKRAAKSNGIIVAITDKGGHCGWFDGLGAGSWVDRVRDGNTRRMGVLVTAYVVVTRPVAEECGGG